METHQAHRLENGDANGKGEERIKLLKVLTNFKHWTLPGMLQPVRHNNPNSCCEEPELVDQQCMDPPKPPKPHPGQKRMPASAAEMYRLPASPVYPLRASTVFAGVAITVVQWWRPLVE